MNDLDRRLLELNEALIKLGSGLRPSDELILQAQRALIGASINTGAGNDLVIINNDYGGDNECDIHTQTTTQQATQASQDSPGTQGTIGPTGPAGPPGPQGPAGTDGECICENKGILVTDNYAATAADYYIGVASTSPVTITLPADCKDGHKFIVKAEMGSPMADRKITVLSEDSALIDGKTEHIIKVGYHFINVILRDGNWWII